MKLKPVYAIVGDDDASKEIRLTALKNAFAQSLGTNNIEIYDAALTEPTFLIMNLTTPSLFGGGRLVILRNFDAWGEGVKKTPTPSEEDLKDLTDYVQNPQEDTILVFVGVRFPKKLVIWKEFYRAVEEHGKVMQYDLPKEWEMKDWVLKLADDIDLKITPKQAEVILELIGKDSLMLSQELNKIKTYTVNRPVTDEDIEKLIFKRPRAAEFKLLEALSKKDCNAAIRILNDSIESRVPIHKMVYPLMKELRILSLVKDAMYEHKSDDEIAKILMNNGFFKMKPKSWLIKQYKKRAYNYTKEQIIKSIWTVATLDYELKGGLRIKRPFQLSYELTFYNIIHNSEEGDLYP